ncbi:MAG: laccase domain-containing protein [Chthoniobacterales bacterium]|nr:laccase domain-containing protein [Chthoniobacterales bacterium]
MAVDFEPLGSVQGARAAFVPRIPGVDVATDRETALARLAPAHRGILADRGFDPELLATAEQVHGNGIAVVTTPGFHAEVDALVTAEPGLVLGIYVADCAAVYIADRRGRAVGLVHSGRAGTALDITGKVIGVMQENFGADPADLTVHLSPCIRPPLYETDFAAAIAAQARARGVREVLDDGICTGRHVDRYYSYRVERGRTGRMLAALTLSR